MERAAAPPEGDGAAAVTTTMESGTKQAESDEVRGGDGDGADSPPKCPNLRGILRVAENRRVLISVIPTLTLAIMGGAVLPVAWAFSVTGITAGILIMVVVASANAYTSDLLLRQAFFTGCLDYETLGLAVGGRAWPLTTEISIVVLLLGTITGGIAQVGEAGASGLTAIWSNTPDALISGSGRLLMVLVTAAVIWPLCMVTRLRQDMADVQDICKGGGDCGIRVRSLMRGCGARGARED